VARIFLCHANEDKPQVREIYQRLQALGFSPWLDEIDIVSDPVQTSSKLPLHIRGVNPTLFANIRLANNRAELR